MAFREASAKWSGDRTTAQLASPFGIHTSQVTAWKKQLMDQVAELFVDGRLRRPDQATEKAGNHEAHRKRKAWLAGTRLALPLAAESFARRITSEPTCRLLVFQFVVRAPAYSVPHPPEEFCLPVFRPARGVRPSAPVFQGPPPRYFAPPRRATVLEATVRPFDDAPSIRRNRRPGRSRSRCLQDRSPERSS